MNVAVVYKSVTGHSKKIAKAVAAEFSVTAQDIKSRPELKDIDLLFFAGGIYGGKSLNQTTDFIKSLNPGLVKRAALITSSASQKNGQDEVRKILTDNKIEVAGEFSCRGGFLFIGIGHPNKKEIAEAVEFCKNLTKE